jgi:multidrug resistance efflux pump
MADKTTDSKKPFWYGLAVGVVVLAIAMAYKIVVTPGPVLFKTTSEGFSVEIDKASREVQDAERLLGELRDQLALKDKELQQADSALRARDESIKQLLAKLDATRPGLANPAATKARLDLSRLLAQTVRVATTPAADAAKLKLANEKLNQASSTLRSLQVKK